MKEWIPYKKPEFIRGTVQDLKRNETPAEKVLWKFLKNKQLDGYKFYRQKAVYVYTEEKDIHRFFIADFYCHSVRLIVELDGDIHNEREVKEHDKMREFLLKERGYSIIRFSNKLILEDITNVLSSITSYVKKLEAPSNVEGVGGVISLK